MDFIDKLRQRPNHHKQQIAAGVSVLVTFILVAVWFSTLSIKNNLTVADYYVSADDFKPEAGQEQARAVAMAQSPLDTFTASVSDVFSSMIGAVTGTNGAKSTPKGVEIYAAK